MQIDSIQITRLYQLISEGILLYFVVYLLFALHQLPAPFISYLSLIVGQLVLFAIVSRYAETYIAYIVLALLVGTFCIFVLHYPIIISIAITVFFCYRFTKHLQDADMENEKKILFLTLFAVVILSMFFADARLLVTGIIQYMVVILGFILRQVVSAKSESLNKGPLISGIIISFGIVIVITMLLRGLFETLYENVAIAIGFLFSGIVYMLDLIFQQIDFDIEALESGSESSAPLNRFVERMQDQQPPLEDVSTYDTGGNFIYLAIITFAIIIMAVIIIRIYRRKITVETEKDNRVFESTTLTNKEDKSIWKHLFSKSISKPNDRARQLFFDFETFALNKGFGRKKHETVEEWFIRENFDLDNVTLYENVRYGEQFLTEKELELLKEKLYNLKKVIEQRSFV